MDIGACSNDHGVRPTQLLQSGRTIKEKASIGTGRFILYGTELHVVLPRGAYIGCTRTENLVRNDKFKKRHALRNWDGNSMHGRNLT
ncbi:hypothetical protein GALL_387050 [mine drainage metagenome]|uniref:Uncharacterized protein n=1 Tax=mine drainage metagenome TaxID=410659 RepID=A0A1J5Q7B8_9ZZZZ